MHWLNTNAVLIGRVRPAENGKKQENRNTLHCDQSNYSSHIVLSHIPNEFGQTRNSAIRSADTENPTLEPNMKWIGRRLAEIWAFEFFKMRGRSSVGRGVYPSNNHGALPSPFSYLSLPFPPPHPRKKFSDVLYAILCNFMRVFTEFWKL